MKDNGFSWVSIFIRFFFALLLVFSTYNPEAPYSFYYWALQDINTFTAEKAFAGVVLLIGWTIYIRATIHSLGFFGLVLTIAFFSSLLWVIVDWGWIPMDSIRIFSYVVLFIASWILTTGMSWSFIRRKMSGQYDVVEGEEAEHQ